MGLSINGKEVAQKYREEIKKLLIGRKESGLTIPKISTIVVGKDGGSLYYVKSQSKLCIELGIEPNDIYLDENITQNELINLIDKLNNDDSVNGIILMMPLPKHIDTKAVTSKISYKKDLDGLTDINNGKFYKGEKCFVPCTPKGIIELIKSTGCKISGKNAVVIGRSNIVGKPVAQLLLNENATVTICHSKTENIKEICSNADILISAIGRPNYVTKEFVKEGAIVIDVGTSSVNDKITGDVNYGDVINKAAYVTPVPGGVGAMTTTMLLKNLCEALE